jgi:hypothetical protein
MRRMSGVAVLTLVVLASGCGGDSQTYSVEETKAAFTGQDYVLESAYWFGAAAERDGQAILAPRDGGHFVVVVTTDSDATEAWPDFERMQDADSFDVRRANVAVFADDGVSATDRARVLAALRALPDRGASVDVAGG